MDDITFTTQEELYQRVRPALKAKKNEMYRLGYTYIKEEDIWNYLKQNKWSKTKNLMLIDIVQDILHANNKNIDNYVKDMLNNQERIVDYAEQ